MDDAASTVYCPMFSCITEIPEWFREGNGSMSQYSETSAFWLFNQVSNWAYTKYSYMYPEIMKKQQELELGWIDKLVPEVDLMAESANTEREKIKILTHFSNEQAKILFNEWKRLYHHLLITYIDGNVNRPSAPKEGHKYTPIESEHPKYSDAYYRNIVDETGDKLRAY